MPVGHARDGRPMGSYNSFLPFFFDFFLVPCSAFFSAADTDKIAAMTAKTKKVVDGLEA